MAPKCVFCPSEGKRSKEHIWPEWMAEYFERSDGQRHRRDILTSKWKENLSTKEIERPGHLSTHKVRVVCKSCNNGWMSRLESKTKPVLVPMLKNQETQLTQSYQETLALWITVKTIVGEYSEPDIAVTPEIDRHLVKEQGRIPDYYAIYLGHHSSGSDSAWLRTSMTLALTMDGPDPPLDGYTRNTQSIAFLCGPLFLFVLTMRVNGIKASDFMRLPKLTQIFPPQYSSVRWPNAESLNKQDMGKIAYALDDLKNHPNFRYGGDLC